MIVITPYRRANKGSSYKTIPRDVSALDDIAAKHEIEENLAVVTFGGQSKIEHHLSNDYTSVRERIGKIHTTHIEIIKR